MPPCLKVASMIKEEAPPDGSLALLLQRAREQIILIQAEVMTKFVQISVARPRRTTLMIVRA